MREECPLGEGAAEPVATLRMAEGGLLLPLLPYEREGLGYSLPGCESERNRGGMMGQRDERKITGQSIRKREKWACEDLFKCVLPRTLRAALPPSLTTGR